MASASTPSNTDLNATGFVSNEIKQRNLYFLKKKNCATRGMERIATKIGREMEIQTCSLEKTNYHKSQRLVAGLLVAPLTVARQ